MKIYICGPTNQELVITEELFEEWENRTKRDLQHIPNIEVINPVKINTQLPWGDYKDERMEAVRNCDAVLVLNGFINSSIASEEFDTAVKMKKRVFMQPYYNQLIDHFANNVLH
jgi:hypothetical protein